MITTVIERAKGFLLTPVEMFQKSRADEAGTVFSYFVALLLINAILSAIVAAVVVGAVPMFAGLNLGAPFPVIVFFAILIGGFICTIVFAAWVHLWVYLFGGRKGIMQTINAIIYGQTPRLLFGWIPFIGFIFVLWSLIINILGIRELQEISSMKATLAVAIAVIIPLALMLIALAYFLVSSVSVVPSVAPVPSLT